MRRSFAGADERTVRTLDGVLGIWVALWLVIGAWSAYEIWQLSSLSRSTIESGHALDRAGSAFQSLGGLPIVGDGTAQFGGQLRSTAADIVDSAQQAGRSTRRLSVLLGLSIFLIPVAPVAGVYLPLRISRRREITQLTRAVRADPDDRVLDAYLARRAVTHLPYAVLRQVSADPDHDLDTGQHRALADAELLRLGVGARRHRAG